MQLLDARSGEIAAGKTLPIMMGDASGTLEMTIDQVVGSGQDTVSAPLEPDSR